MTIESQLDPTQAGREDATTLCTHCGLCCMGALHDKAVLKTEEIESARSLGLTVTEGEHPTFALGCIRLDGTRCSVYDVRPSACRTYRCQLLRDLDAGLIPIEEARNKTRIARDLFDRVDTLRPPNISIAGLRKQAASLGKLPAADHPPDKDAMLLQLHFTALALYLDKHFMNHNDGQHFTSSLVDQPVMGE